MFHVIGFVTNVRLLGFLESRIARYKIPKQVSFIEVLPWNAAGKVDKNVLRSMVSMVKDREYGLE